MNQRYFVYMKFDGQDDLSVCIRIFNHLNRISIRIDILSWTQGFGETNILLFVFSRLLFIYNNLQKS